MNKLILLSLETLGMRNGKFISRSLESAESWPEAASNNSLQELLIFEEWLLCLSEHKLNPLEILAFILTHSKWSKWGELMNIAFIWFDLNWAELSILLYIRVVDGVGESLLYFFFNDSQREPEKKLRINFYPESVIPHSIFVLLQGLFFSGDKT